MPVTEGAKLYLSMSHRVIPALTAAALVACGCADSPSVKPVYDKTTHELSRLDYDYDKDGDVDVRTYLEDGRVVKLEGDANADGAVDRWEYYDRSGKLERIGGSSQADGVEDTWVYRSGGDTRIEISTRRDKTVDRREFYRDGALIRTERDTNQDGLADVWEEYDGGSLQAVLFDEEKRSGRPSRRVVYTGHGDARVEIDNDGDGRFVPARD